MKLLLLPLLAISISTAVAVDDTPENRAKEAKRYMEVMPPEALFADMAENIAKTLPPDQRDVFKATLTKHMDVQVVSKAINDAIVKNFTADEIKALTDFYASDIGKSAMAKMGAYMADVLPPIQAETMKAMAKANQQMPDEKK